MKARRRLFYINHFPAERIYRRNRIQFSIKLSLGFGCIHSCKTGIPHMKLFTMLAIFLAGGPVLAQTASEIHLFDLNHHQGRITLTNPRNISQHPGYDNQPFFHPDQPIIFYSSFNQDGRADIRAYDMKTGKTSDFTQTDEREYSPTVTPDEQFLSCIIQRDNEAQDLGKYPLSGGPPIVLIDSLTIGYHAWINPNELLLFVLGEPMTLRHFDLRNNQSRILAENIGRSLHRIPGQAKMSFVQKNEDDKNWKIMSFDPASNQIEKITTTLPGQEDLAWLPDGKLLMSDGQQIFLYNPGATDKQGWQPITMPAAQLKGITRLAISPDGKRLALVAEE